MDVHVKSMQCHDRCEQLFDMDRVVLLLYCK